MVQSRIREAFEQKGEDSHVGIRPYKTDGFRSSINGTVRDIIESQQFTREWLEASFFPRVSYHEPYVGRTRDELKGKLMVALFYEPSTRTRISFETAMLRLGGMVISSENARDFSSAIKGEILADTTRVINMYHPDVIVLRHYETGSAKLAAEFSDIPVINAGDGKGQHPTQSLLDLYTIKKELGKIDGLAIAMSGDLKRGRTVRSLVYLLSKFRGISIFLVSPPHLRIGEDIKEHLSQQQIKDKGITFDEFSDIREVAPYVDAIYQTRDQAERASLWESVQRLYYGATNAFHCRIDKEVLGLMKSHARIMHPLPRNTEISLDLDHDKRSAYFRQAGYGVPVRMAVLEAVCG